MKLFAFIATAALWLGVGHAYAQSRTASSLPIGTWVLVDMETLDADGQPVLIQKSDWSYKPTITNSELDFYVHDDIHLTFFKQERLERGYEIVGDKLRIYPGLRGESAHPALTLTILHLDAEKLILERPYNGNTLQYTYRFSK